MLFNGARLARRRPLPVANIRRRSSLLLFAFALAGGVARVALGLGFGLEGGLSGGLFFLFAGELGCGCGGSFRLARLLLGLGGFAGLPGLGTGGSQRLALGLTPLDLGIVGAGLGLEFVEDILPRLLRRLLAVSEVRFLESTHKRGLVVLLIGCQTRGIGSWRFSK